MTIVGNLQRLHNSIILDFTNKNLEEGAIYHCFFVVNNGVLSATLYLYDITESGTAKTDFKDLSPEDVMDEYVVTKKSKFKFLEKEKVKPGKVVLKKLKLLKITTSNFIIYEEV